MNSVVLMGRITRDIELRYTQNNTATVRFTLAVDRDRKKGETDFISCQAWGKTAEMMDKYLAKGSRCVVQGSIRTGSYDDRNGNKLYTTDVNVDRLEIVDFKDSPKNQFKETKEESPFDKDFEFGENEELPF